MAATAARKSCDNSYYFISNLNFTNPTYIL